MELIQVDALQPQALQAAFNRAPQMVGTTIRDPGSWSRSHQRPLFVAKNRTTRRVGIQRLRDHQLVGLGAVTIRSVHKIHTKFDRSMENSIDMPSIPWFPPTNPPHRCIAPKPNRLTVKSPRPIVPARAAPLCCDGRFICWLQCLRFVRVSSLWESGSWDRRAYRASPLPFQLGKAERCSSRPVLEVDGSRRWSPPTPTSMVLSAGSHTNVCSVPDPDR